MLSNKIAILQQTIFKTGITTINCGGCGWFASMIYHRLTKLNIPCEIWESERHVFCAIKENGIKTYFDAEFSAIGVIPSWWGLKFQQITKEQLTLRLMFDEWNGAFDTDQNKEIAKLINSII